MPAVPRPAATTLLLRGAGRGFEIFMVQRHRKSGFMPSAWVFPGGRVDAADALYGRPRVTGGRSASERMRVPVEQGVPLLVAAVRETFEEAGIWLGSGALPEAEREPLAGGERALADLLDAHDATLDLDVLEPWSWWITPEAEPRRYDTRFLVARAPDADGSHDEREVVDSAWFTPADAVARCAAGELAMAPPTWWTLCELAECATVEAVLARASQRVHRPVMPIFDTSGGSWRLLLPGHPGHPEAGIPHMPTSIAFAQGRWWADRT